MLIGKNYKLISEIGSGTFGKVWLAEHLPTSCQIAIKILEKNKILDDSDVKRVTRELKIAQSISHPHLVQLYHLLETTEYVFLVMEFLPGGELYDHIVSKKKLSEEECFLFFSQIVSSVEYLHSLNIAHRDLKPENLLLDRDRKIIKLVDFGLGRFYESGINIETACGSPCYAPPEMLSKLKYDPLKADIWSLGIVLFAMIAGYLPFDDENTDLLYKKIIDGKFTMPGSISVDAADLLSLIIQTNPNKRISISEIKNHNWWLRNSQELRGHVESCCLDDDHPNLCEIDAEIVNDIAETGIDPELVMNNVKNRVYSEVFCQYQLLREKKNAQQKTQIEKKQADNFRKKKQSIINANTQKIEQKFKNYQGALDLDFLSMRKIEEVYAELRDFFVQSGFSFGANAAYGSFILFHPKHDVGFKLSVMTFVDFEEGCCVCFDDFKPNKTKFESFFVGFLKEKLKDFLG